MRLFIIASLLVLLAGCSASKKAANLSETEKIESTHNDKKAPDFSGSYDAGTMHLHTDADAGIFYGNIDRA